MFAERMLLIMRQKKITKKKLCSDLGIGINQIKYWQDHNNVPSGDVVSKIAQYLDVPIDFLLCEDSAESYPVPRTAKQKELFDRIDQMTEDELDDMMEIIKIVVKKRDTKQ